MNIFTSDISVQSSLNNWSEIAEKFSNEFMLTDEAKLIGDNCVIYQHKQGGFPKNIFYPDIISPKLQKKIDKLKLKNSYQTIDNNATTTEIIYLSRLYTATQNRKYMLSALDGIEFLLNSQYENGGFPQEPKRKKPKGDKIYKLHITYNDNAMINVLKLLTNVSKKTYPFEYVDDKTAKRAKIAVEKGIDCILKTQIKQNNKLTAWCQQYERIQLIPFGARTFELPSIDGGKESTNIVLFLMSLDNPSQEIKNSVESAIEWFEKNKIKNKRIDIFVNNDGEYDAKITDCISCPPIWAKNYDIETNKPFFVTREGCIKYNINEIPEERRIGYEWYGYYPQKALDTYKTWKYRKNR